MITVLSTLSDNVLFLYQVLPKYLLIGFGVMDLNSRVNARVVANVDRWMYGQTDNLIPVLRHV